VPRAARTLAASSPEAVALRNRAVARVVVARYVVILPFLSQAWSNFKKSYQDESLRPVTIKQIIEAEEAYPGADFKIDGHAVTQVTFVGQVRDVNPQATNVTYKIDDGTGTIEVKKWIDADKRDDELMEGGGAANTGGLDVNQYVRIWGRMRPFNNKRHVVAHFLRKVEDFNEVNYHLLETTYVHLYLTKGAIGEGAKQDGGDGMFVDGGAGYNAGPGANAGPGDPNSRTAGCTPESKKMFNFLLNTGGGNEGVHLNVIASGAKMTVQEVLRAADEMLGKGLVYTTIDDETWAILDY
jgi:hypothetical protein